MWRVGDGNHKPLAFRKLKLACGAFPNNNPFVNEKIRTCATIPGFYSIFFRSSCEPRTNLPTFLFSCFRKNNTAVLQNTVCVGSTAKSQLGRRTHLGRLPPSSPYWRNVARHCCKICIPGMGLLNSDHHMSGVISSRALASDYVASMCAIELTDLLFQPIFACENASLSELQYLFREVQTSHLL